MKKILILEIFICANKGEAMFSVEKVKTLKGLGLDGDRYARGTGSYKKDPKKRQATFIDINAFNEANKELLVPFTLEETRRNVVADWPNINDYVGKEFKINGVRFLGTELCDPCDRPSKLANKPNFKEAFTNRGGLRAEVLDDGEISKGDEIIF